MKVFSTWLAAAVASAQSPPRIVADYPLARLRPYVQTSAPLLSAFSIHSQYVDARAILGVPDPNAPPTGSDFSSLLLRMFAGDHEDDLEVRTVDNALLLDGLPAAVDGARRVLDGIVAALGQPVAMTIAALPLDDGELPPTVLDAAGAARLLQQRTPIWRVRGTTRNAARIALGRERWVPYVRDIDLLSATTIIGDPKVDNLFAGARLVCEVHRVPDGRAFVVNGAIAFADTLAVTETATGIEGMPTIDLPDSAGVFAPFSARIADGGAVVIAARCAKGLGPGCLMVVRCEGIGHAPVRPPGLVVLPVSALLTPSVLGGKWLSASCMPYYEEGESEKQPAKAVDCLASPAALGAELARDAGEPAAIEIEPEQGCLILQRDPAAAAKLEAAVGALVARVQNAEVQLSVPRGDGGAPLFDLRLPTIVGRDLSCFVGLERTTIADFDVEISQALCGYNPYVALRRSGLSVHLSLRGDGDALHAAGALLLTAQGERRPRKLHGVPPGTLAFIDSDAVAIPWDAPLPWDDETVFGDGPEFAVGGVATATRLAMRVVRR